MWGFTGKIRKPRLSVNSTSFIQHPRMEKQESGLHSGHSPQAQEAQREGCHVPERVLPNSSPDSDLPGCYHREGDLSGHILMKCGPGHPSSYHERPPGLLSKISTFRAWWVELVIWADSLDTELGDSRPMRVRSSY